MSTAARVDAGARCRAAFVACALLAAALASLVVEVSEASARTSHRAPVRIQVLSTRADLVANGEALVAVDMSRRVSRARITLNGRVVRHEFSWRSDHRYEGVLTGLKVGRNRLEAILPNGRGAEITITNHPNGGPLFAGPQVEPWKCQAGARDAKCDAPAIVSYLYKSTNPAQPSLQPYDPSHPPTDVAMTTTTTGVKVPFIVREEIGYEDRDQYRIEVLDRPGRPWTPWAPQSQWDHKLMIMHGSSCSTDFGTSTAPFSDLLTGESPVGIPTVEDSSVVALGMGYVVGSTALDNSGADCNVALQAESLVMLKQHIIDELGTLRFTIGNGCSGGSLAAQWIANAYPGIYQGLIVGCSFPDALSTATQVMDYQALGDYFNSAAGIEAGFTPTQQGEIEGTGAEGVPAPVDSNVTATELWPVIEADPSTPCTGITKAQEYEPQTNPRGVRCGILDWNINLLGPSPRSTWDAQEKAVGHGFAGWPLDNVGVQYGLAALNTGEITPTQFVALNAHVGGFNIDGQPTTARVSANLTALANAYRTGLINEANHLNRIPIIDMRGSNDPGAGHDAYRSFAMRARLQRDFGTHANQVIWEGALPLFGDAQYPDEALRAMNRWLDAISADHSRRTLPQKVIADRPKDITDQCSDGDGTTISHHLCPSSIVHVYGTPRTVAGDSITTDANKCQLVPLNRSSYRVSFTNAEWAEMKTIFATGVCDYAKPGVKQQPTVAWLTYQTNRGRVIYGGRPLGPAPTSHAITRHRH